MIRKEAWLFNRTISVSAYVGSSKNLKALKVNDRIPVNHPVRGSPLFPIRNGQVSGYGGIESSFKVLKVGGAFPRCNGDGNNGKENAFLRRSLLRNGVVLAYVGSI